MKKFKYQNPCLVEASGFVYIVHCLHTALCSAVILSEKYQQPSVRPAGSRAKNSSVSPTALTKSYIPGLGHVLGMFHVSSVKSSETDSSLFLVKLKFKPTNSAAIACEEHLSERQTHCAVNIREVALSSCSKQPT